jgi:hypothetical protein
VNLHDPVETVYTEVMLCESEEEFEEIRKYLCPSFRLGRDYVFPKLTAEMLVHISITLGLATVAHAAELAFGFFR